MRLQTIFLLATAAAAADQIADLRADYDTPSSPFVNGQTAAGKIPDTLGTGSWTFFGRSALAPGGSQTALIYYTAANSVRNANAFGLPAGSLNLPGISNTQLICCGTIEGSPASNELALHPGSGGEMNLVMRWTAGAGISGPVTVQGAIRDIGITVDGIGFQIFNQAGTSLFNYTTSSGGTSIPFNFTTAVASGGFLDFVVGPKGNYFSDQSAISINITGATTATPEPGTFALIGVAGLFAAIRMRQAKNQQKHGAFRRANASV